MSEQQRRVKREKLVLTNVTNKMWTGGDIKTQPLLTLRLLNVNQVSRSVILLDMNFLKFLDVGSLEWVWTYIKYTIVRPKVRRKDFPTLKTPRTLFPLHKTYLLYLY